MLWPDTIPHRPHRQEGQGDCAQCHSPPPPSLGCSREGRGTVFALGRDHIIHPNRGRIETELEQSGRLREGPFAIWINQFEYDDVIHQLQVGHASPDSSAPISQADHFLDLAGIYGVHDNGRRGTGNFDLEFDP